MKVFYKGKSSSTVKSSKGISFVIQPSVWMDIPTIELFDILQAKSNLYDVQSDFDPELFRVIEDHCFFMKNTVRSSDPDTVEKLFEMKGIVTIQAVIPAQRVSIFRIEQLSTQELKLPDRSPRRQPQNGLAIARSSRQALRFPL